MRQRQGSSLTTNAILNDMATRQVGDGREDVIDRRTDLLNSHEVRLSILEDAHRNSLQERQQHSKAIQELNKSLHETVITLKEGLALFNGKFESLLMQIKIGFYVLSAACTVAVFLFGAFIAYNQQLDEKYLDHSKQVTKDITELQNKKS